MNCKLRMLRGGADYRSLEPHLSFASLAITLGPVSLSDGLLAVRYQSGALPSVWQHRVSRPILAEVPRLLVDCHRVRPHDELISAEFFVYGFVS